MIDAERNRREPLRPGEVNNRVARTMNAWLSRTQLAAATIEAEPGKTIVPASLAATSAASEALELLARDALPLDSSRGDIQLHNTLGEGGMGIVHLATQTSLGREVAVKSLKPEFTSKDAALKLLREAWVTGSLEHPNIVPVHDIACDEAGSPLVVLKRIQGDEWASLMHDPKAIAERFQNDDALAWNLDVWLQVGNALRFAHRRDIVHRDIKPENVMVGSFGETYLVDWGLALRVSDGADPRLPHVRDAHQAAGTLHYMAPEMLGDPQGPSIGKHSDIYLLGAVLYEIAVGHPPHDHESLTAMMASILLSTPKIPDSVPRELARIIERAMAAEPAERHPDIDALLDAVQAFVQHRGAAQLTTTAHQRLKELSNHLGGIETSSPSEEEGVTAFRLFGACSFGFRNALEAWPDQPEAQRGLVAATEHMVCFELERCAPQSAQALLSSLDEPDPELAARVRDAVEARRERIAEAERLARDADPSLGRRTRSFLALVVGSLATVLPLLAHIARRHGREPHRLASIAMTVLDILFLLGLGYWARESMLRTRINRAVGSHVFIAMFGMLLLVAVGTIKNTPLEDRFRMVLFGWSLVSASLAVSIDLRLLLSTLVYAAGYVLLEFANPRSWAYLVMAGANFLLTINLAYLWWRPKEDLARAGERIKRDGHAGIQQLREQGIGKFLAQTIEGTKRSD